MYKFELFSRWHFNYWQEGPRYNALHVAARSNQAGICQLLLDTLEDPNFIDKLYGHTNETDSTRSSRINFIVDLYLNTPDKAVSNSQQL